MSKAIITSKPCKKCGIEKPISEFHLSGKGAKSKSGWNANCKICFNSARALRLLSCQQSPVINKPQKKQIEKIDFNNLSVKTILKNQLGVMTFKQKEARKRMLIEVNKKIKQKKQRDEKRLKLKKRMERLNKSPTPKVTKEEVSWKLAKKGIYLVGQYVTTHTKTIFGCNFGHRWETRPTSIISKNGTGCPKCAKTGSDCDAVYIWKSNSLFNGLPVYKVGVTSYKLGDSRIKEVSKVSGLKAEIIQLKKVKVTATNIEKELKSIGIDPKLDKFKGSTEFRAMNDDELKQAIELILQYAA